MSASSDQPLRNALDLDPAQWQRTSRALRRIAWSIVRDEHAADDVVQSAWLRALERDGAERGPGWLRRLVRSRAIDALRRAETRGGTGLDVAEHADPSRLGAPADELAQSIEVQRAVLDAVEALDEPYRATVWLRWFEELSPSAIAARTGVPLKTVKTRQTRALALLRERLARRWSDPRGNAHGWLPALVAFAREGRPRQAAQLQPNASSAPLTSLSLLVPIAMKKLAFASLAALALVAGWLALDAVEPTDVRAVQAPRGADALAPEVAALEEPRAAEATRQAADEVPRETEARGTPAAPATGHGALRVRVAWSDGSAAPGVQVVASTDAAVDGVEHLFRQASDAQGSALFPALPPGQVLLRTDRGEGEREGEATVVAGQTVEAAIGLRDGVEVEGRVVDPGGAPVAGAGIWLTSLTPSWTAGSVVAESDAAGRFRLRDLPKGPSLGALAGGYRPSALVDLDLLDRDRSPLEVTLVVERGGATLAGRVVDAGGAPIAGALIALGRKLLGDRRFDGSGEEVWSPRTAESDEQGRFSLSALPSGETSVSVRADGWPPWSEWVTLVEGSTTRCDVVLRPGATLRGRVTDEAGRPVPGARIHAFEEPLPELYLQNGQVDDESAFEPLSTLAGEDGRYELADLPPSEVHVYALEPKSEQRALQQLVRYVRRTLSPAPGESVTWDPVLADGHVIHGVARTRDGAPLRNVFVILTASETEGDDLRRASYSEDGSFRFIQLELVPHDVRVQIFDLPPGASEPRAQDVLPDGPPLELVADFDAPAKHAPADVRVRFADRGGRLPADGTVALMLEEAGGRGWRTGDGRDGAWVFEGLEPGAYRLLAFGGDRLVAAGAVFELAEGQSLDLGTLETLPGATLSVVLVAPEGFEPSRLTGHVRREGVQYGESFALEGTTRSIESLEPGPGSISISGANVVPCSATFDAPPGEVTRVELRLEPAAAVRYRVLWAQGSSLTIHFLDRATGEVAKTVELADLARYANPIEWTAHLPLGAYTLEATLGDGRTRRADFDVTSLDPELAPRPSVDLR